MPDYVTARSPFPRKKHIRSTSGFHHTISRMKSTRSKRHGNCSVKFICVTFSSERRQWWWPGFLGLGRIVRHQRQFHIDLAEATFTTWKQSWSL